MTADTFSNTLGFLIMGVGNDNNSWGGNCSTSVFQIFEDAIANILTLSATGGTLDLSGSPPPAAASQVRYATIKVTGVLTSNQTIIVPNLAKSWIVANGTTGAFSLFVKTTSGAATQIPQSTDKLVRCNGSNGIFRLDLIDIGELKDFATASVPSGFLECDGTAYSRTGYPDLFAAIGTTWGLGTGGDVTTFGVPNLKDTGRFRRSRTGSVAAGTYQANQNAAHTHTGTTDSTNTDHTHTQQGSFASGTESANHTHPPGTNDNFVHTASSTTVTLGVGGTLAVGSTAATGTQSANHTHTTTISGATGAMNSNVAHTHTFTTGSTGGSEARPEAAVVLSCIRY